MRLRRWCKKHRCAFKVFKGKRRFSTCVSCVREYHREWRRKWRADNVDLARAKARAYRRKNKARIQAYRREYDKKRVRKDSPEQRAARNRLCRTGWTADMYEHAWRKQKGRCALCNRRLYRKGKGHNKPCADHCHKRRRPRAILCHCCNLGIAFLKEDIRLIMRTVKYLNKYRAAGGKEKVYDD